MRTLITTTDEGMLVGRIRRKHTQRVEDEVLYSTGHILTCATSAVDGSRHLDRTPQVPRHLEWDPRETRDLVQRGSKIGEGATCTVYRSQMSCGTQVAIKVVDVSLDVTGEIATLSTYRHPSIVNFMGYARGKRKQYLVFEHLPNMDVAHALYGKDNPNSAIQNVRSSWVCRTQIALDLARALAFLHSRRPRVFHRDVKSGNLLLDEYGRAKLADFGLAVMANTSSIKVNKSEGTPGYADPTYMETQRVGSKTDVFSLGVVLVELLTGQCPAVYARDQLSGKSAALPHGSYIIRYFTDVIDVTDPCSLMPYVDTRCVWPTWIPIEWSTLALRCMGDKPDCRPSAVEVLNCLNDMLKRVGVGTSPHSLSTGVSWDDERRKDDRRSTKAPSPSTLNYRGDSILLRREYITTATTTREDVLN